MISAYTLSYGEEAIGIVRAAAAAGVPVSIAFTLETDGRLPSGEALGEAIERVDAETGGVATYFMVNCVHPTHFSGAIEQGAPWFDRLGGFRANASRRSHAELEEATDLENGDPVELAAEYEVLEPRLLALRVLGGCCGTDSPTSSGSAPAGSATELLAVQHVTVAIEPGDRQWFRFGREEEVIEAKPA